MNFKEKYPDFAAIEKHIRDARAERSVAIAVALSGLLMTLVNAVKRLARMSGDGLAFERDRQAIAADPFLRRSVPKY